MTLGATSNVGRATSNFGRVTSTFGRLNSEKFGCLPVKFWVWPLVSLNFLRRDPGVTLRKREAGSGRRE